MNNFFKNISDDSHFEISLTPLIDTVLVLLIIFIISMPIVHQSIKISLPNGARTEYCDKKNDICFAIDQYGRVYNEKKELITPYKMIQEINKQYIYFPDCAVIIFADRDASCGNVIEYIDKIKEVGVKYVYCKTKKIVI